MVDYLVAATQQFAVFTRAQGCRFAGGSGNHQGLSALSHMKVDQRFQLSVIDIAIALHWGHQRNNTSFEHIYLETTWADQGRMV